MHVLAGVGTTMFVFPFVSDARKRRLVKRWSRRLLGILNVSARVRGELTSVSGNVLLVANHISWLDIFVLNAHLPVRFVAKAEIARWPVLSRMVRGAGTVFIKRERKRDTHRVIRDMAEVLANGDIVAIFPEGTTTHGHEVLPFKSSLLQPIIEAGGHVQPVAIRYRTPDGAIAMAPTYVGDTSFASSFFAVCAERALRVELTAQPALPARDAHRRNLAREAEASIRTALAEPASVTALDTPAGQAT
jgi:1-acyl-sn-glycerol-3-phosphate acyltransferase